MPERVFIDVGAHNGATIAMALEGGYPFDRLISAEPDPDMVAHLEQRFSDDVATGRYQVAPVGLGKEVGTARLYGDNSGGGASVIATKFAPDARASREIQIVDWGAFLDRYSLRGAALYVKINAEGAEIDIVDSLLAHDRGEVQSLVVDYDIIKTPFGGWKKWRSVRALTRSGLTFQRSEDVFPKHGPRPGIHNWLSAIPELVNPPIPQDRPPFKRILRVRYLEVVSALGLRLNLFRRKRR